MFLVYYAFFASSVYSYASCYPSSLAPSSSVFIASAQGHISCNEDVRSLRQSFQVRVCASDMVRTDETCERVDLLSLHRRQQRFPSPRSSRLTCYYNRCVVRVHEDAVLEEILADAHNISCVHKAFC